jgi:KDO2-lipid IV(A) lauroyltransferase
VARLVGPLTPRHKVATDNLRQAYPEKSDAEIEDIAREMWDSMARLFAEYIFLDAVFDFDPYATKPGLVEVEGIPIFERLRDEKKPHIFFTAHTGNFELLPICAATFGLNVTALFRPPNNPYIADKVLKARRTNMGHLVPSKAGAAWSLAHILDEGGNVGMLVDQKFRRGVPSTFFNRPVKTNPLLAKLARQYDCDVYPARCIRLPGGRYRLELYERMELPRDDKGEIDVAATAQLLNDTVETWVREYPGQWMWFHKRWG